MKTIKTIVKEIQELQNKNYSMYDSDIAEKHKKKDRKTLQFLGVVKKYMMSQPTKEYLEAEQVRLEMLITAIMDRFVEPEKMIKGEITKLRKAFEKEYEIPKYRRQLRTIYYILN